MDLRLIIVVGLSEVAALFFVWRLWRRRQKRSLAFRVCWSLLLLVPVVGILFYGLSSNEATETSPGWGGENNQGWGDDYTGYHP